VISAARDHGRSIDVEDRQLSAWLFGLGLGDVVLGIRCLEGAVMPNETVFSRREVLYCGAALIVGVAEALGATPLAEQGLTASTDRPYWRFCNKCHVMFSTEARENVCGAGGQHVPDGYDYRLPYDREASPTAQPNWRSCRQCQTMFYNGYQTKGRCPVGQGHVADTTFKYVLSHDVPGSPTAQPGWRFCSKCFAMFYDADPNKGRCPAGDGHVAQGYNFVLPHIRPR
jgi:hypothetical protein